MLLAGLMPGAGWAPRRAPEPQPRSAAPAAIVPASKCRLQDQRPRPPPLHLNTDGELTVPTPGRERGAKVNQLLRQGEPAEALQMLFDEPRLAWQKDEHSGGYPVHLATWKVRGRDSAGTNSGSVWN